MLILNASIKSETLFAKESTFIFTDSKYIKFIDNGKILWYYIKVKAPAVRFTAGALY